MSMTKRVKEYNELAALRNLSPRKWFRNLAAVEAAIKELGGRSEEPLATTPPAPHVDPLPPLSNVSPSEGGRRLGGADRTPEPEAPQPKETKVRAQTSTSRAGAGQAPNPRNFKPVRAGTVRARVLELMADGGGTAEQIARKVGIEPKQVMQHAYCTWRDAGIGYEVRDDKRLKALFPTGVTLAKAIKKD